MLIRPLSRDVERAGFLMSLKFKEEVCTVWIIWEATINWQERKPWERVQSPKNWMWTESSGSWAAEIPILRVWEYRKDPAKEAGTESRWPTGYKENRKASTVSRKKVPLEEGLCEKPKTENWRLDLALWTCEVTDDPDKSSKRRRKEAW